MRFFSFFFSLFVVFYLSRVLWFQFPLWTLQKYLNIIFLRVQRKIEWCVCLCGGSICSKYSSVSFIFRYWIFDWILFYLILFPLKYMCVYLYLNCRVLYIYVYVLTINLLSFLILYVFVVVVAIFLSCESDYDCGNDG